MLSKYYNNPKDKEDFAIALVVIALAGILIGYFTFYQDSSVLDGRDTLVTQNTKIDTLHVDGVTYVAVETEDEMVEDVHPSKSKIVPVTPLETKLTAGTLAGKNESIDVNNDEEIIDENVDVVEAVDATDPDDVGIVESTKDLLDSIISDEDELVNDDESIIVEEDSVQPQIIDESLIAEAPDKVEATKPIEKKVAPSHKSSAKSKCIVVIGAYGNQKNIRKLIGRLDQEGYPVFKVPFRGLTRVGAYVDCAYRRSLLQKFKREYSPDAFLMRAK